MEDWDSQGGVGTCLTALSSCWWRKANTKIPHVCCSESSRNVDSARMQESLISKILQLLQLLNIRRLQGKQTWSWGWLQSRMTQPEKHSSPCCAVLWYPKDMLCNAETQNINDIYMKTYHLVSDKLFFLVCCCSHLHFPTFPTTFLTSSGPEPCSS